MVHPLVAVAMLIAIGMILALPRKKAVIPFLLAFFTIPVGQVLVLGGVHFTMLQILVLTVLGRMAAFRGTASEKRFGGGFNALDNVVVVWSLVALIVFALQFRDMQAVIKGLGDLVVTLGSYLAIRFLIPDRDTVRARSQGAGCGLCVSRACSWSANSSLTKTSFIPSVRINRILGRGTFALRGRWGLSTLARSPEFRSLLSLAVDRKEIADGRLRGTGRSYRYGIRLARQYVVDGLRRQPCRAGLWPMRKQMRLVRWGLVALLVALHLVMHGPVWSLIEKIDLTGGSSSYHRYMLVDNCIRHFGDWWLLGCKNYGDWGFDMWDLCNQFVVNALTGGLITLVLYLAIFKRSFRAMGWQGSVSKETAGRNGSSGAWVQPCSPMW